MNVWGVVLQNQTSLFVSITMNHVCLRAHSSEYQLNKCGVVPIISPNFPKSIFGNKTFIYSTSSRAAMRHVFNCNTHMFYPPTTYNDIKWISQTYVTLILVEPFQPALMFLNFSPTAAHRLLQHKHVIGYYNMYETEICIAGRCVRVGTPSVASSR